MNIIQKEEEENGEENSKRKEGEGEKANQVNVRRWKGQVRHSGQGRSILRIIPSNQSYHDGTFILCHNEVKGKEGGAESHLSTVGK